MSDSKAEDRRLKGGAKFAVDFGPLLVFLVAYFFGRRLVGLAGGFAGEEWCLRQGGEMYLAVAAFLPAFAGAFAYSVWKERRVAPMLFVSGVAVGVLGVLTLVLHNKTFFYMKPTIVYLLFAGLLAAGLWTGRNFMKTLFDGALHMSDAAWRTLTIRYSIFFVVLAIANEIAWRVLTQGCPPEPSLPTGAGAFGWLLGECGAETGRCTGEADWVKLKVFGFTAANVIFAAAQAPFIAKHMQETDTPSDGKNQGASD